MRMYQAMIVDDDEIIRDGLKSLIDWEGLNVLVSCTAENGRAALDYMEKNQIDLLVTDVSMPEINGIQLIQKAKKINQNVKCVIISAYSDFQYVKEAVRLGIENYILKPIDEQELTNTVASTVEKMNTESMEQREKEGDFAFQSNILSRLLYEEIDEFELMEKAEFIKFDLYAEMYMVCYVKMPTEAMPSYFSRKLSSLFQYDEAVQTFCIRDLEENYILIFSGNHLQEKDALLKKRIQHNFHYLQEEFGCTFHITLSDYVDTYTMLPACYKQARKMQNDSLSGSSRNSLIQKVVEYVQEHYAEDINLKTISYEFGMNAFYLGQLFKESINISFTDYITDLRIQKAKELLKKNTYKVWEVSQMVGYSNTNYFYTLFKRKTGMSPAVFREH